MTDIDLNDAPVFVCGDREITFVDGQLHHRFRPLPGDLARGGFQVRDAVATDGDITYRVRGGVRLVAKRDSFTVATHAVLIGPRGEVETINLVRTFLADGEELPARGTGSCTLRDD